MKFNDIKMYLQQTKTYTCNNKNILGERKKRSLHKKVIFIS